MDLHPIPRQITTFEFKLIGFMTVKQFGYVLLAGVVGYLFFLAIPIQILNATLFFRKTYCVGELRRLARFRMKTSSGLSLIGTKAKRSPTEKTTTPTTILRI
jgi:hypothetical protein